MRAQPGEGYAPGGVPRRLPDPHAGCTLGLWGRPAPQPMRGAPDMFAEQTDKLRTRRATVLYCERPRPVFRSHPAPKVQSLSIPWGQAWRLGRVTVIKNDRGSMRN